MKTKLFLFALFAMVALSVSAQSDYSNYLNKAMSKIDEGDCASAKKFYNVYKELSGKSVSSLELLIEDCIGDTAKHYAVGDKIIIDKNIYKVAYVEDNGKHGFAVCEMGSGPLTDDMLKNRLIPTLSEFDLIKENNEILKLNGQYWSPSVRSGYRQAVGVGASNDIGCNGNGCTFDILYVYRF